MKTVIKKLALNGHQENSNVHVYISPGDEDLGTLFVIAEVVGAEDQCKKIAKQLIEEAHDNYFNSVARDTEKALEDALQKVNFSISELIKNTKKDWLEKSNIVIASVEDDTVNFSKIGRITSYLISGSEVVTITDDNLEADVNPVKAFGNIYSGTLPSDAGLLFLNDAVLDYLSQEKLRKIVHENDSKRASAELEKALKKAPSTTPFGAVIIKPSERDTGSALLLDDVEEETEVHEVKKPKKIKKEPPQEEKPLRAGDEDTEEENNVDTPLVDLKPSKNTSIKDKKMAKKVSLTKALEASTLTDTPDEEETDEDEETSAPKASIRKPKKPRASFSAKSLGIKLLILLLVVFGVWFGVRGFLGRGDEPLIPLAEKEESTEVTQVLLNDIQAKFIEAQNYLIVDDEENAQAELRAAAALITELPETTEEEKRQKNAFSDKVNTQLLLAQGVNLVIPELLVELNEVAPTATELVLLDTTLYTVNKEDNSIYSYTIGEGNLTKLEAESGEVGKLLSIIDVSSGSIYFYHSLDGLAELDIEKKKIFPIEWNRSWKGAPRSQDIYQNKLYVISTDNTLLKYANALTGYTQEVEWITSDTPVDLTNVVSLAIDSTIWVLKSTGTVVKLFKGAEQDFNYTITPPLKAPTKMYTDLDIDNLYILDPPTKRIVILGKDGSVVNQFTAEELTAPVSMAVDENNSRIYVLDSGKIFVIGF